MGKYKLPEKQCRKQQKLIKALYGICVDYVLETAGNTYSP